MAYSTYLSISAPPTDPEPPSSLLVMQPLTPAPPSHLTDLLDPSPAITFLLFLTERAPPPSARCPRPFFSGMCVLSSLITSAPSRPSEDRPISPFVPPSFTLAYSRSLRLVRNGRSPPGTLFGGFSPHLAGRQSPFFLLRGFSPTVPAASLFLGCHRGMRRQGHLRQG